MSISSMLAIYVCQAWCDEIIAPAVRGEPHVRDDVRRVYRLYSGRTYIYRYIYIYIYIYQREGRRGEGEKKRYRWALGVYTAWGQYLLSIERGPCVVLYVLQSDSHLYEYKGRSCQRSSILLQGIIKSSERVINTNFLVVSIEINALELERSIIRI